MWVHLEGPEVARKKGGLFYSRYQGDKSLVTNIESFMKLSFTLTQSPDLIFDYLTDMKKFTSLHPVIKKMDHLGQNHFLVHETLKWGFIPYSFTYPVTIESDAKQKTVHIKATIMKLTRIEMHFVIRAKQDSCVVDETISIKTILPIKGLIRKIFREQHEQFFKNIDEL